MNLPNAEVHFWDINYSLVSFDWICGEFAKKFYDHLVSLDVLRYVQESNDCDDFAFRAWQFMRDCNAAANKGRACGFGVMSYKPDNSKGFHAINAVFQPDDEMKFWEPQTQSSKELSENEKNSANLLFV